MERFRMPGLDLPKKKDTGDALNRYRIKDSPGGAAELSPGPLSPTGADSARRDEDELGALAQQLATFNRRLTEESLDKYRIQPTKKREGDPKNENDEEVEFQIDEEERRQLEAEMQRLLTRKHTLELRRSQRSAGDQANATTTATACAPARAPAGLDRFRVQPSGSGSAPVTPTGGTSSSTLGPPVDKNRRLSVSGAELTVRSTSNSSSSSVSPPTAKPAPLSQTQVGLTASAPSRIKSLPATALVASFNKPTIPTTGAGATSGGGGGGFVTPKVRTSFGLPSPRSAAANVDPFSKYRVQNDATAGEGKPSVVVAAEVLPLTPTVSDPFSKYRVLGNGATATTAAGESRATAEVRPLTPTVSDPFSKYRISPSGGSSESTPLASPASAEAVRDVKPVAVDPLSKYRRQPDATSSTAAPASTPKPAPEAAKSSGRPEVAKIPLPPDGPRPHTDEEGTASTDEDVDGDGDDKKSARDVLADEERFLWNNLDRFSGDK